MTILLEEPETAEQAEIRQGEIEDRRLDERIRARAYQIYLAREGEAGDEVSDWYRAEAEIMTGLRWDDQ